MYQLLAVCFGFVGLDFTFCWLGTGCHFKETRLWVEAVSGYRAKKLAQGLIGLGEKKFLFSGRDKKLFAIKYLSPKR